MLGGAHVPNEVPRDGGIGEEPERSGDRHRPGEDARLSEAVLTPRRADLVDAGEELAPPTSAASVHHVRAGAGVVVVELGSRFSTSSRP
jgi:hypothetical protein